MAFQGYGTCSETVATQTPFVYVPRPLFVEEFGLKRLMDDSGTAVPMARADFEAGRWARLILQAWEAGWRKKEKHRAMYGMGGGGGEGNAAAVAIALELEKFMEEEEEE